MKILIIGGTGTISSAITRQLAVSGHDLWLLNRGTRKDEVPANVRQVITDIDNEAEVAPEGYDLTGNLIGDKTVTVVFDCSKLKRAVPGFKATTRFDEGVRRCVAYLMDHPELQVEDPEFDAWCDRVIEAQEKAKEFI